jgi:propanediol utilization protein
MENLMETLVEEVSRQVGILLEASGRHVHLSRHDVDTLFGAGYQLTPVRPLSQPGQFVCKERVTLVGQGGELPNVVVLGPERSESQVEISLTDATRLGIPAPPVRQSGKLEGTPGIGLRVGERSVTLPRGLMVAQRHIHLTPAEASRLHLEDGQRVKLKTLTSRPVIWEDVVVRVSAASAPAVHLDYDEANACGFHKGDRGVVLW